MDGHGRTTSPLSFLAFFFVSVICFLKLEPSQVYVPCTIFGGAYFLFSLSSLWRHVSLAGLTKCISVGNEVGESRTTPFFSFPPFSCGSG